MSDAATIASRMIQSLAIADRDLDSSVGSVPRKIIDVVAEAIAEVGVTEDMLSYRFDVDSKRGADLDDFVGMFGFSRFPAGRARGTVTLLRPSAAPKAIYVPSGTQVSTAQAQAVVFGTVAPAYMSKGTAQVQIPIQAVLGGEGANLPAGAITVLVNGVEDISSEVVNSAAIVGGTNEESDEALIVRFKRTVFRSLAGTEDMYLGVAMEGSEQGNPGESPTAANVVGVTSRYREQVQIKADGTATSTIPPGNVKYLFDDSFVLGPDIEAGQVFTRGVHYNINATVTPPVITSVNLVVGEVYDLEFEYTSSSSRNDPGAGISNRVDLWVNGQRVIEAGETFTFSDAKTFTTVVSDPLLTTRFVRLNSNNVNPAPGAVFSQLSYGPIVSVPDIISVAGVAYTEGTDYHVVHDNTAFGYGPTSKFGLEWVVGRPRPTNGQGIGLTYLYNRVPRDVEAAVRRWRLVGTDARVHQAKSAHLVVNLAVMYVKGISQAQTDIEIFRTVSRFIASKGFAAIIQVSDLLQVVKSVTGVDAARLTNSGDSATNYGIQEMTPTGVQIKNWSAGGYPIDVLLRDDQIPVLQNVNFSVRAQNTIY